MTTNFKIAIRSAQLSDGPQIGQLIYDTVRTVNRKDYTEDQVVAWAPDPVIFSVYDEGFAYVAESDGVILGFAYLTPKGLLSRFYVHRDFQGQGVGSRLLEVIEHKALEEGIKKMTTEASITAKPFFLAKGFIIQEQQTVVFRNTQFINYKMYKYIANKD